MYKAEVLYRYAVVQHFFFGKLLPFEEDPDAVDDVWTCVDNARSLTC